MSSLSWEQAARMILVDWSPTVPNPPRFYLPLLTMTSDAIEISAAFYLGHGPIDTPCTSHILPMTGDVPSVRCAVAASAACHLGNRLDNDHLKQQSLHLRLNATECLRAELWANPNGPDLSGLVCMLLLAQLDVGTVQRLREGTLSNNY